MTEIIATSRPAAKRGEGRWLSRAWALFRRVLWIFVLCALLIELLPADGYIGPAYPSLAISAALGTHGFSLVSWEAAAWAEQIGDIVRRPGSELLPQARHDLVIAYFRTIADIDRLQVRIEQIYADPARGNPSGDTAPLQARLDDLRRQQGERRPAVERIIQEQVASVLREEGLLTAGQVWPPVLFQFTESPDVLIISPRDRIAVEYSDLVQPDVSVAQMEHIEAQAEKSLGVSALVDGTGGLAAYPTLVVDVSDLPWVLSTVAHEWFHTYLAFHPLGWHYFDNQVLRTMNETAADMVGSEVGKQVLAEYYPELVPRPAAPPAPAEPDPNAPPAKEKPAPPAFSFSATMRQTYLQVQDLLKQGRIDEGEAYMEQQRQVIVSHGYVLRKLNQAYFAFHGSYAEGGGAYGGVDPIGVKLEDLRKRAASLHQFVVAIQTVTTVEGLDAALAKMGT